MDPGCGRQDKPSCALGDNTLLERWFAGQATCWTAEPRRRDAGAWPPGKSVRMSKIVAGEGVDSDHGSPCKPVSSMACRDQKVRARGLLPTPVSRFPPRGGTWKCAWETFACGRAVDQNPTLLFPVTWGRSQGPAAGPAMTMEYREPSDLKYRDHAQ